MLIESYAPVVGGMETQAVALSKALVKLGFDVQVVTRKTESSWASEETLEGIHIHRVGPSGSSSRLRWAFLVTCLPKLFQLRHEIDLFFVPGFRVLGMAGVLAAKLFCKPSVLKADSQGEMSGAFFHAGMEKSKIPAGSWISKGIIGARNALLKKADFFVSLYDGMTDEYLECGILSHYIQVIPNMVDAEKYHPVSKDEKLVLRETLNLPADQPVALFVGRVVSYKGVPVLVQTIQDMGEQAPYLVILGEGGLDMYNCEAGIRKTIEEKKLASKILMPGSVDNVHEYMQAADFLAFPTENDALPLTLIEAMACGLPVITTPVGGIPAVIQDEENGLLIEPGSTKKLESAMTRLIKDKPLQETLKINALKSIQENYAGPVVAAKYEKLFRDLLF